jgi:NAD dependent epimerase/dehydratase family enzyme
MLHLGAVIIGTETELILKSRKVYPGRLLDEGFDFEIDGIRDAFGELMG